MRLLPGSHRSPILPHEDTHAAGNLLTRGQRVLAEYDEGEVVDVELQAGQMSLHHVRAIHGSRPNGSGRARIGVAIRYMTPEVRPLRAERAAVLVRGARPPRPLGSRRRAAALPISGERPPRPSGRCPAVSFRP